MNIKTTAALAAVFLALAACGNAPSAQQGGGKGPISENRTTAFKTMMPEFAAIGKMVKGEEAFEEAKLKAAAATFAVNAKKPFEFFQNDAQGNGDALPAVWEKSAEFKAEQDKFLAAVDKLNAEAQTGNLEVVKAAYGAVGASCKSCHDSFRHP